MQYDIIPTKTKYGYKVSIQCPSCNEGHTFDILIDTIFDVGTWLDEHYEVFHTKKDMCPSCHKEIPNVDCRWCGGVHD